MKKLNAGLNRAVMYAEEHPYRWLNGLLSGFLLIVLGYTAWQAIWPGTGVHCYVKALYGHDCPACGLTRAMASLWHGNIRQALQFHKGSLWFAAFLLVQLLLRGGSFLLSAKVSTNEYRLAAADGLFTAALMLFCFGQGYGWF